MKPVQSCVIQPLNRHTFLAIQVRFILQDVSAPPQLEQEETSMIDRLTHYLMDNYPTVYVVGTAVTAAIAAMVAWQLLVYLIFGV